MMKKMLTVCLAIWIVCIGALALINEKRECIAIYYCTSGDSKSSQQQNIFENTNDGVDFRTPLYTPHLPISINGDGNFIVGQNGVVGGTGTKTDPYIIEGWEIETVSSHGIRINSTDAYFVVRNCYIHGLQSTNYDGIVLSGVRNGTIEFNCISCNANGTRIAPGWWPREDTSNCIISNNSIISNNNAGIIFEHIGFPHHTHNIISCNNISDNNVGIQAIMFESNIITLNNITNNKGYGVDLVMCVGGGMHNLIHHNNFIGNNQGGVQARNAGGVNYWNTTVEGNYWSDYTKRYEWASNNGVVWNHSYELAGVSGVEDHYPLVFPVSTAGTGVPQFPTIIIPTVGMVALFLVRLRKRKLLASSIN